MDRITQPDNLTEISNKKVVTATHYSGDKRALDVAVKNIIPIATVPVPISGSSLTEYGEVNAIAANVETDVAVYIVPPGKKLLLEAVEVDGGNLATYKIYLAGSIIFKKSTYWTQFDASIPCYNREVLTGVVVKVTAEHDRPDTADFNATIIGSLIDV